MMRKLLILLLCVLAAHTASAQYTAVRVNALGWATGTLNAGVDVAVAQKWSVELSGYWNPIATEKLWANVLVATVGVRRWRFESYVGLFWGLHSTLAKYKVGNSRTRYNGWTTGIGSSVGYSWMMAKRWNLNLEGGVGIYYMDDLRVPRPVALRSDMLRTLPPHRPRTLENRGVLFLPVLTMKAMMKHTSVALLVVLLAGCAVTSRLERRQSRALAEYAPREQAAPKPVQTRNYMTVQYDSTTYYIAEAAKNENDETVANFRLDEVVVVAKSRTLPERKCKVLVDFVVRLPKELQGCCRSIVVMPHLHKAEGAVHLQDLSIRGGLFSRLQDRSYWQFAQYVRLFRPDAAGEQRAFERFVKHPYPEDVRLDSIVEGAYDLSYYYSQEVPTRSEGKTMLLTLHGAVVALDGSRYDLPPLDTLRYHISSKISFADTTTRYVTKIIEKYAVVNDRNYLSFRVNDTRIIDMLGDNAAHLARIESLMEELVEQREFYVDSIVLTASASLEGGYAHNERLVRGRAAVLKQRLGQRFGRQIDTLLCVRWIAEDWDELARLIAADGTIAERDAILGLLRTIGNPDRREAELRRRFPKQYRDIRERLYPLLRAVNFKYDLRRVGMVKDTIHTTVPDTLYARGVELLNEREYNGALRILRPYEDRNTAVAMLSLGYDEQAYEVLCRLKEEATVEYLKAVACARMGRIEEGKAAFRRACELLPNFEYRGNLDPEIRELIMTP